MFSKRTRGIREPTLLHSLRGSGCTSAAHAFVHTERVPCKSVDVKMGLGTKQANNTSAQGSEPAEVLINGHGGNLTRRFNSLSAKFTVIFLLALFNHYSFLLKLGLGTHYSLFSHNHSFYLIPIRRWGHD